MNKYQVDTVPHIICGGFNKEETENALIDLNFLGIDNVLVLRGDPIKSEIYFKPEQDGHSYASELLQQVSNLNKGILLEPELAQDYSTDFCIGVAGYPEKHFEAPNMKTDLHYLKQKVDLGAEYIVTQLFFDNKKYFDFVKQCRDIGINVPIIPGIKPISTKKQLTLLPQRFYMDIPSELSDGISQCKDNVEARQFGVEWAIEQCKELKASGVPCLHFYTMGNSDNVYKIASELF
jgi:methylenetetrahydrofolate reductase (NADPH)